MNKQLKDEMEELKEVVYRSVTGIYPFSAFSKKFDAMEKSIEEALDDEYTAGYNFGLYDGQRQYDDIDSICS